MHRWYAGESEGAGPCLASGQCMSGLWMKVSLSGLSYCLYFIASLHICMFCTLALAWRRVCWQSNCCIFWWRMLMNRLGTHSSIGLKPTSALQTACRHAMHSIQFMLRRMLPSVLNSYMPAPQHPVLNQWQIYKQGSSFSFVYGPCTSKSVDWLHLMTHRYSYNISCSISHTVVLSRLTVVLQGMSSHSYNKNIKADSVSAIFVQGFQVEQTIFSLLLLVNGLAVDRLDCTVLQRLLVFAI